MPTNHLSQTLQNWEFNLEILYNLYATPQKEKEKETVQTSYILDQNSIISWTFTKGMLVIKYLSHSYYLELEPLFPRRHKEFQIAKFDFHRWTCWPYCCFYQRQGKVILKYFIFSWFESGKLSLYHNILCLVVCKCVYRLIIKKICVYQLFNNWLIITNSTIPIIMSFSFNILITSQVNIHYNYSCFEFKIDLSTYDLERFILAPQGFHKPKVVLWLQWGCYFVI